MICWTSFLFLILIIDTEKYGLSYTYHGTKSHSGSQDIALGVNAEKIEDLLRVKCRLSNYENSSTFETVLYTDFGEIYTSSTLKNLHHTCMWWYNVIYMKMFASTMPFDISNLPVFHCTTDVSTLSLERNAPWKVAFLFRKSVDRWTLLCISFCQCSW